jgi:hypothetical protein
VRRTFVHDPGSHAPFAHDHAAFDEILHGPAHRGPGHANSLGQIDLVLEPVPTGWCPIRSASLQLRGDLEVDRNRTRAIDDDAPYGAEFCLPTHIAFPYFVMTKY